MNRVWMAAVVVLVAAVVGGAEQVQVPGTKTQFPSEIETKVDGKAVKMVLTGTALRRRFAVHVYALGSYVQEGVKVQTAEDLAACTSPKRLELIMQRDVGGKDMADAFLKGIRLNHPEPAFAEEVKELQEVIQKQALAKDDHVVLTFVPGVGLHCNVGGKTEFLIKNVQFAQAVWDIYFGKNNLGDAICKALLSRL
jgi:Chalcone isomerase-like